MKVLYISYDGMTDPLGSSQVMPYLFGLSKLGHEISLLSFEKKDRFVQGEAVVKEQLFSNHIDWFPEIYTSKPPVFSTLKDLRKAKKIAFKILKDKKIQYIHCRSYIAALVGLCLHKKASVPFLFDMRGFWADERIDGQLWSLKNPVYRMTYCYFKKKEKEFLRYSHHIISLTYAGKEEIMRWKVPGVTGEKITVIPCCTDTEMFKPTADGSLINPLQQELHLTSGQPVISYLGSIGTWYMAREMFDFFRKFLTTYPTAIFLIITRDAPENILKLASQRGISEKNLRIRAAARKEVPGLLALCHATLFFIKPAYSKTASSPTKMGESLSMGIPVICNDHVGDCTSFIQRGNCGIVLDGFDEKSYAAGVAEFAELMKKSKNQIRDFAVSNFDLKHGVQCYHKIYSSLEKSLS